jgi:hypothetical protein
MLVVLEVMPEFLKINLSIYSLVIVLCRANHTQGQNRPFDRNKLKLK